MATTFPYTLVSCPCTSFTSPLDPNPSATEDGGDDDSTFNSHSSRANFSLYPYEHLLYCDECHQIRCPRCWSEEIMNWYCPNCLFEVASSVVKSDGNRCTRNCYNCPMCTAPLAINGLESSNKSHLAPPDATQQPSGPFFLACPYCDWSSLDVGIQFDKPTKITDQLVRKRQGNRSPSPSRTRSTLAPTDELTAPSNEPESTSLSQPLHDKFATLTRFYKDQLQESSGAAQNPYGSDSNFNSPNNLARIMSLYGGLSYNALKKAREKPQPMREALNPSEGLDLPSTEADAERIKNLSDQGYESTTSMDQRLTHPYNHHVRSQDKLWPVATLLRTRRSKRCRGCRHIIARPEPKMGSTRYKIRLLAQNNIPRLSLRLLAPTSSIPASSFALTPAALQAQQNSEYERLNPGLPVQFLLTLTNPLFEPVKVTLATPATTPGPVASRITILCPTFSIGAASDMWDPDAISSGNPSTNTKDNPEDRQPEAGKVWERGRNHTTVVVEIIPGTLQSSRPSTASSTTNNNDANQKRPTTSTSTTSTEQDNKSLDKDILEIPVFVRVEWEAEISAEDAAATGAVKGTKEQREIAFWSVLGAGRILGQVSAADAAAASASAARTSTGSFVT